MKFNELRQKNVNELHEEINELLKIYLKLRMQKASQQLTNTSVLRQNRRAVARIKTILNEKQKGI
jgi:large subunit ribosomal protein L29